MSKRKSDLWNYFEIVGKSTASCNMCKRLLSFKTSITNLKKHIEKKHVLVLDPLLPSEKTVSVSKKEIFHEEFMETPETNSQDKQLPSTEEPVSYIWNLESIAERQNVKKQLYKRQNTESHEAEEVRLDVNSVAEITKGLQSVSKSLQDLTSANATTNNVKEQHLLVEKRRNVIFRHFLMELKTISEKINVGHPTSSSHSSSCSATLTHMKRKLEIDEDGTVALKRPRTGDTETAENRLRDILKEEKRIEIEERRLKLEERKVIMEGQMEERRIEIDERKLKLEEQKVISEDQSEEKKLEIDEAQMKLKEQKFVLEVQTEERKLGIDEKRLKLEERKVLLEQEKKSYSSGEYEN